MAPMTPAEHQQMLALFEPRMVQSTKIHAPLCDGVDLQPWFNLRRHERVTDTLVIHCLPVQYHQPSASKTPVVEHWQCQTALTHAKRQQTLRLNFALDASLAHLYPDSWCCELTSIVN